MANDPFGPKVVDNLVRDKNIFVINFRVVRDELRKYKKTLKVYENIAKGKKIQDSKQIDDLANEYFKEYRKNKGGTGERKMRRDFKIVACASMKNCDIVYSEDNSTMKCEKALKSYKIINSIYNYRTPEFKSYKDLRRIYLAN